jgi:membrane protease YdiL (CAAX protease family)
MSARIDAPARSGAAATARAWAAFLVVPAGIAFLAARPFVVAAPRATTLLFATGYALVAAASTTAPSPEARPGSSTLSPAATLAVGLAAVGAAAVAAGEAPPAAWGAAVLPLSLLAAVAEEALFRRVAYGRLLRFGVPVAVAGSALLFALVHLPAYGAAAFPVDLGAGLLLSWQRWASGTWTVPAATHAVANLLAVLR